MVATTLLEGAENAPDVSEHPGHEEESEGFMHPWAREMYRRGFSFNGGERTKLFLNTATGLVDVSDVSNADSPLDGRALLTADFDDDGDEDLFVHNIQRERHHLFRSDVDPGERGFLSLEPVLVLEERTVEAIGAIVRVRAGGRRTAQVLSRGSGYASSQAASIVFGLGDEAEGQVEVLWPGGVLEDFGSVASGTRARLVQGTGKAEPRPRRGEFSLADPLPPGLKMSPGAKLPVLRFEDGAGELTTLDPVKLTKDGPIQLEIWASYCRPCIEKLPGLGDEHRAGTQILALSVDIPTERQKALDLLARHRAEFPAYFLSMKQGVNEDGFDTVVDLMRLPIPTTLLIGEGGVLIGVRTGAIEEDGVSK